MFVAPYKIQQINIIKEGKTEDTNKRTMTAHGVEDRSNARINDK
jgi:hypothetical protein